jgi:hypothetical protein
MALVVPDSGEVRMLGYIVNRPLVLHLYTNQVVLEQETFTSSTFVNPPQISGYAAKTLAGSEWTVNTTAGVSSAIYPTGQTYSFSTQQDIQGYYVTDGSNNILWAEEFPGAPFQLPSSGGEIAIRPQIQLN